MKTFKVQVEFSSPDFGQRTRHYSIRAVTKEDAEKKAWEIVKSKNGFVIEVKEK